MEMLNETAIRIIEEIPIETDEQKAALELATEALLSLRRLTIKLFMHSNKTKFCISIVKQKKTWTTR